MNYRYKNEIGNMLRKEFFPLLLAVGLQQLLALIVNLIDNFMLGQYMEAAMSGAFVVNQIHVLLMELVMGAGGGVSVLCAQYWGQRRTEPIRKIISSGLNTALLCGVVFTLATSFKGGPIVRLFTEDPAIIEQGTAYLSIMRFTYLVYPLSAVLMMSLQSVQTAHVGTIMSASTVLINLVLDYGLIFGNLGLPALGIRGAAVATLVSRIAELVIVLVYILVFDRKIGMKAEDLLCIRTGYYGDFFAASLPKMISGSTWGAAMALQTSILGHLGSVAVGANSIALVVFQLLAVFGFACSQAASAVIGKVVGSRDHTLLKPYVRALQAVFILIGIVTAGVIFAVMRPVVGWYHVSEETKELALIYLTVFGITCPFTVYQLPVMAGIIGGGGNTRYQAVMELLFMWGFTLPLAYVSAFVMHWGPVVTFVCLKIDQVLKCVPNAFYCNSYRWVRDRTR